MLGSKAGVCSLGEIHRLSMSAVARRTSFGNRCSCGSTIPECATWQARVHASGLASVHGEPSQDLVLPVSWTGSRSVPQRVRGAILAARASPRGWLTRLGGQPLGEYMSQAHLSWQLFDGIARLHTADTVVDSSKSLVRMKALAFVRPTSTTIVHMTRDIRGYAYSAMRHGRGTIEEAARDWCRTNTRVAWAMRRLPSDVRRIALRYEDLCGDPKVSLERVLARAVELGTGPAMADARGLHMIPGNPWLQHEPRPVREDTRWRESLDANARRCVERIAHRAGLPYDFHRV